MKKQLQLIACTVYVLVGLTGYGQEVQVGDEFTSKKITYKVTALGSPNTVTITANTNTRDLALPGIVTYGSNDFEVTRIRSKAFENSQLTSVIIPESVIGIDANAFIDNPDLKRVVAEGTTPPFLDPSAFDDRSQIDLIVPLGKVEAYKGTDYWRDFKSIKENFRYEEVIAGSNTLRITGYIGRSSVNIPGTITHEGSDYPVTHIGNGAFQGNQLTSVTIPNSVITIGHQAFQGNQLTSVTIPNSVIDIGGGAFGANRLTQITLGQKVETIGGSAFRDNFLTQVTIPGSVTSMGNTVFNRNRRLTKVGVENATDPPTITARTFSLVESTPILNHNQINLIVPKGAGDVYKNRDHWADFRTIEEERGPGYSFTANGLEYVITASSDPGPRTVTVTGRIAEGSTLTIPDTAFFGLPYAVTAIKEFAFQDDQLTSVEIPETVTSIGKMAFDNNQFTEVVIPNSVTTIGASAFRNSGLTGHLEIPNSVTEIKGGAFSDNQLTSVTIPESPDFTKLDIGVFYINNLKSVTIPRNITIIEKTVFANNLELFTVVMKNPSPKTVSLEPEAFDYIFNTETTVYRTERRHLIDVIVPRSEPPGRTKNSYLAAGNGWADHRFKSITEEGDVGEIFEIEGITYKITGFNPNTVTITGNANTGDLTIPVKVERLEKGPFETSGERVVEYTVIDIEAGAFQDNQLTRVIIPDSVTSIGANAFAGNPDLATVELGRADPPSIEESTFAGRDKIDVIVPRNAFDNYVPAWDDFKFKSIKAKVAIDDTFTVERDATTAVIKYQVTAFGPTNTVTVINNEDDDHKLLEIFDPVEHAGHEFKVTQIGGNAFVERDLIGALTIPDGVESIGESAFQDNQLTSVTIPESVTGIGESAFLGNRLEHVAIPDGVESIEAYAFSNNALSSVTIPNNVTSIGEGAFSENALSSVTIPNNVTSIGEGAFSENALSSVDMPESVETIGHRAFALNSLTEVSIPNSVTGIGESAFQDNQLTSVTIPEKVTSIGADAFTNNPDLATVVSKSFDPPSIEVSTFTSADRDQIDVIVPMASPSGRIRADYEDAGWTGFRSIKEGVGVTIDAPALIDNLSDFTVTFRFDLDVRGFTMDDIDLGNAIANHFTGSGSVYTVEITPRSCDGAITIEVPSKAIDMPNFTNFPASARVAVEVTGNCDFATPQAPSSFPMIPTAFTPNGDGANDRWIIDHLSENASVRIYDRHGTIIFSSDDGYTRPWDGTSGGHSLPAGSYLYLIQNGRHKYRGSVTILL
ncbi:leucine-rich repeat protein [Fulvivirgaceae bacterium BMA12]|uniref:Leucine-rich repeat protein n=1 Tax=Agaribacillus aureus TaxID=3051825 RepID=A0ABT8L4Y8_9BACT|nr:leucine-rich repeat protein [Fulvivirgaceae bacterium BMA12]